VTTLGSRFEVRAAKASLLADDETQTFTDQVDELEIVALCPCRSEGCAAFDTAPCPPGGVWPDYQAYLPASFGVVGVAEGRIVDIDIPYDPELNQRLRKLGIG
jgi:hypothetical protein